MFELEVIDEGPLAETALADFLWHSVVVPAVQGSSSCSRRSDRVSQCTEGKAAPENVGKPLMVVEVDSVEFNHGFAQFEFDGRC